MSDEPRAQTTPALQAKARLREAWWRMPREDVDAKEILEEAERLIADIEAGAIQEATPGGRVSAILADVAAELGRAMRKHPPIHSPHEGYAVILEEIEELLDAGGSRDVVAESIRPPLDRLWKLVKADRGRTAEARAELIQVAAMAMRYILDLDLAAAAEALPAPRQMVVVPNPNCPCRCGHDGGGCLEWHRPGNVATAPTEQPSHPALTYREIAESPKGTHYMGDGCPEGHLA